MVDTNRIAGKRDMRTVYSASGRVSGVVKWQPV
jgi:hypothetical protein